MNKYMKREPMSQYHNSVLQSTTPYDKVLQSTTLLYYSVLLSTKVLEVLQSTTRGYSVLQYFSVLPSMIKYYNVLPRTTKYNIRCHSVLLSPTPYFSVLRRTINNHSVPQSTNPFCSRTHETSSTLRRATHGMQNLSVLKFKRPSVSRILIRN